MKKSVFYIILSLIALPAGLMFGLQIATIKKQYERSAENFTVDVEKAVREVQTVYARWNSHTSTEEDAASYNAIYTNQDSTFSVIIAQSVQPYPLLDFEPDTLLPRIRKEQFLRFQDELERTRRRENRHLRELYVLRSIQYCADCGTNDLSIARIFPMDSLIRDKLAVQQIRTQPQIAFYDQSKAEYVYLSKSADTAKLADSPFRYPIAANTDEILYLYFPGQQQALWRSMANTFISSFGLILISLLCYGLAARMLLRHKKLTEMKNDFINNVTHEFKTPIATIAFALANIENEKVLGDPGAIRQFTGVIKDENRRLNQQVEKVLQAAMLDRGALELKSERIDIHEMIGELIRAYTLKIPANGTIEPDLQAAPATLTGDPVHLSNAISNLLDNAVKYGRDPLKIRICTRIEDEKLVIAVADNGIGIGKEQQQLIFEKFYRVPTGNVHNSKGFGLGLSYVKAIVEAHGGRISVSSRQNKGSIFKLSIPLKL